MQEKHAPTYTQHLQTYLRLQHLLRKHSSIRVNSALNVAARRWL